MLLSTTQRKRSATLFSAFVFVLLILLLAAWLALGALAATPAPAPTGGAISLAVEPFASGLIQPVDIAHAGDSRLFVVEQPGRIRIVQPDGIVLATPFLDIQDRVNDSGNEQGLLGLVFEPNDPNVFYVNYTVQSTNQARNGDTIIARYRVSSGNPNVADKSSEQIVLEVDQPYANHNGGDLAFGPDGYLYIALGDGGSGGDPDENAQDLAELLGKLLRIDVVDQATYAIPSTNPYVNDGNPNTRAEIWAFGLRNPWRVSFDRLTDDLYIGDVGQLEWEEIDFQPASSSGGENYGWDCREGNHDYEPAGCGGTYIAPIFEYSHTDNESNPPANCSSITGGYVYRGTAYPALQGNYLFADYCSGKFLSLFLTTPNNWAATAHGVLLDGAATFGEDPNGELYVASRNGQLMRIVDPTQLTPVPTITANATQTTTPTTTPVVSSTATPTLIPTGLPMTDTLYLPIVGKDGNN